VSSKPDTFCKPSPVLRLASGSSVLLGYASAIAVSGVDFAP